jgi:prolyl-tRNA synthetase
VIAPYQVHLIAVSAKSKEVTDRAEMLYAELLKNGIDVLYDDRKDISPGFKFKDADLLGMPFQIIVGEKNLANGKIEIKERKTGARTLVESENILARVRELLA